MADGALDRHSPFSSAPPPTCGPSKRLNRTVLFALLAGGRDRRKVLPSGRRLARVSVTARFRRLPHQLASFFCLSRVVSSQTENKHGRAPTSLAVVSGGVPRLAAAATSEDPASPHSAPECSSDIARHLWKKWSAKASTWHAAEIMAVADEGHDTPLSVASCRTAYFVRRIMCTLPLNIFEHCHFLNKSKRVSSESPTIFEHESTVGTQFYHYGRKRNSYGEV